MGNGRSPVDMGANLRCTLLLAGILCMLPVAGLRAATTAPAPATTAASPPTATAHFDKAHGASLYKANCAPCHRGNGLGRPGSFPALKGNSVVLDDNPTRQIKTVLYGRNVMPGFDVYLDNADIAAVINHTRTSWGNHAPLATAAEVAAVRAGKTPAATSTPDKTTDRFTLDDAWVRLIPVQTVPDGGYFTLENHGSTDVQLVGASSESWQRISLHRSVERNGKSTMMHVKHVDIPAHGRVRFSPGGYHLMMYGPAKSLHPGGHATVTFHFSDGQSFSGSFALKPASADSP